MIVNRLRHWILVFAVVLAVAHPSAAFAQDAGQSNGAVWENAKGPAVASRAPGLWVRAGVAGPEITQTVEATETPSRQQGIFIEMITALSFGLDIILPDLFAELLPETDVSANELFISEITHDGSNTFVEIHNPGGLPVDLAGWAFCRSGDCTGPNEMAGTIEREAFMVFQLGGEAGGEFPALSLRVDLDRGDLGLYEFSDAGEQDQQDDSALRSYIKWDTGQPESFGLEDVAVAASLWSSRSSIPESLDNQSFQLLPERLRTGGRRPEHFLVVPSDLASLGEATTIQEDVPPEVEDGQSTGP